MRGCSEVTQAPGAAVGALWAAGAEHRIWLRARVRLLMLATPMTPGARVHQRVQRPRRRWKLWLGRRRRWWQRRRHRPRATSAETLVARWRQLWRRCWWWWRRRLRRLRWQLAGICGQSDGGPVGRSGGRRGRGFRAAVSEDRLDPQSIVVVAGLLRRSREPGPPLGVPPGRRGARAAAFPMLQRSRPGRRWRRRRARVLPASTPAATDTELHAVGPQRGAASTARVAAVAFAAVAPRGSGLVASVLRVLRVLRAHKGPSPACSAVPAAAAVAVTHVAVTDG